MSNYKGGNSPNVGTASTTDTIFDGIHISDNYFGIDRGGDPPYNAYRSTESTGYIYDTS